MTQQEIPADLKIDAYEYGQKYQQLIELGNKIKEEAKGLRLTQIVFKDSAGFFELSMPVLSDELIKVRPVQCVDVP